MALPLIGGCTKHSDDSRLLRVAQADLRADGYVCDSGQAEQLDGRK